MRLWIATLALCSFACGRAPEDSSKTAGAPSSSYEERFPTVPRAEITTGVLCSQPDSYRYPEHISYCNRDVSSSLKRQIIEQYDRQFDYTIESMNRRDFKIDHLIPLCMGGGNAIANLWPQHKSVYVLTDFLEGRICSGMAEGRVTQKEAISMIEEAKREHDMIKDISARLDAIIN